MEAFWIIREKQKAENRYNAGSKAREDVDAIAAGMGARPLECVFGFAEERKKAGRLRKLLYHRDIQKAWETQLARIPGSSTVLFQFPVRAHTVLFGSVLARLRKRNIRPVAVIHDLETLRYAAGGKTARSFRLRLEEIRALKQFDRIIVHNERMKRLLAERSGIPENRLVSLEIFDYLVPEQFPERKERTGNRVIIAGNLDPEKCGYVYRLPGEPAFELYGANFAGGTPDNVRYNGKYPPDELPARLEGGWGLVWDGESAETCGGIFGQYLKVNNPHKASLYLACGIPVIVWEEAAVARYAEANRCGIAVRSLSDLPEALKNISPEQYRELKRNAETAGEKLRAGTYTRRALEACLSR